MLDGWRITKIQLLRSARKIYIRMKCRILYVPNFIGQRNNFDNDLTPRYRQAATPGALGESADAS
jgi:hypothetical protein